MCGGLIGYYMAGGVQKTIEKRQDAVAEEPLMKIHPNEVEVEMCEAEEGTEGYPALVETGNLAKTREIRRVPVPPNRLTPLRDAWTTILQPLISHYKLQVKMNTKRKAVEMRYSPETTEHNALQKASEYMRAFMLGFAVEDAVALLRLDDLFIESFEVKDVKRLVNDHMGRGIGRIVGKNGATKYAIENATRTRIVVAGEKIHILGSFTNIRLARNAICDLILGSPVTKVYGKLNLVGKRLQERM